MKKYNNLLAVIEPKRDYQVALKRAIEFARYNPNATITALRLIYDFSYDIHILNRKKENSTKEEVERVHLEALEAEIKKYANPDVHIIPKKKKKKDLGEAIIDEMINGNYDLLIKGANRHGVLDSIIFTPIDWYLLRNSPTPVVIAKEHPWDASGNIVVALDFTSGQKRNTNIKLLREAQMLATITKGKIHLINSAPVLLPTVMLEVPNYAPEVYAESILKEHQRRLIEFAKQHNIPPEQCHIEEGLPEDVIPNLCRVLAPQAVLIGSAGRSGVSAAFIGNTCEEIVDYIDADLFVYNNKTIDENKD